MTEQATPTPLCNTGVYPPVPDVRSVVGSHFDWYRATVPVHHDLLTRELVKEAGPYAQVTEGQGRFAYKRSRTIEQGGDRVATVLYGGPNGHPNVEASGGERAPWLAAMLRARGPHRVTRCDVAVDLFGVGLFEGLKELAGAIADRNDLDCRDVTNRNADKGDTRYLGSRKSSVFARIYEKGKAGGTTDADVPPDLLRHWVRIELEIKPQKEMKELAATIEPEAFWGVSPWTRELAKGALDMNSEPIPFTPRRISNNERAFRHMVDQYGSVMEQRLLTVHNGDMEALAAELMEGFFPSRYPEQRYGGQ